jgi:hypothetical protein
MAANVYKFDFKGKSYSVPKFDELPMGALRKARKAETDIDKAFIIIEEILGDDSAEIKVLDQMNKDEFAKFVEGWAQGAPLGESSDS